MEKFRVLLGGQEAYWEGLAQAFHAQGFEVFQSKRSFLREEVIKLQPTVLVLEEKRELLVAIGDLLKEAPFLAVMLLTPRRDSAEFSAYYESGVRGCLPLDLSPRQIAEIVETSLKLRLSVFPLPPRRALRREMIPSLSARERQILFLVAKGFSAKEVAAKLHLTESSVKTYLKRLMKKLGAHNQT